MNAKFRNISDILLCFETRVAQINKKVLNSSNVDANFTLLNPVKITEEVEERSLYCGVTVHITKPLVYIDGQLLCCLAESIGPVTKYRIKEGHQQTFRPTQPSIPPGSVNEYQLPLGRKRQVWFIPLADEHGVLQVKLMH